MSRLPFELFLALRYLRPKRTSVSVITLISILGVMLGVAVLIVVIAVMSGFDREWRAKILGFNAHIEITPQEVTDPLRQWRTILTLVTNHSEVKAAAPFIIGKVMAKVGQKGGTARFEAPILRGIDPVLETNVSLILKNVVRGEADLDGRGALIGRDLAAFLKLEVGDRVSLYSPNNIRKIEENYEKKKDEVIVPEEVTIRGIFDVGFADYNFLFLITSIETAQELYDLGQSVHGVNLILTDPMRAPQVQTDLERILGPEVRVVTWMERSSDLFNTLALEKNMIFFLLFFIVLVAAFGITSSLITFVVQKTREVGVLKALGATRSQIMWIFLSQGITVGVIGVSTGLVMGLLLLEYRNPFLKLLNTIAGRELLNASIYKLYDLPAELKTSDLVTICVGSLIICTLAGAIPAWIAGRLRPVEALRHE